MTNSGSRLDGKRIVVTGAGSGIGYAACLRFAAEGATVLALDVEPAGLERLAARGDGRIRPHVADVSSAEQMAAAAGVAEEQLGGVDGVYANAGIAASGTATQVDLALWERAIAINLTGVFLTCRVLLPLLERAGGGSIVTQASVGGIVGVPGIAAYAAAKGGVIGLTRSMAVDYAPAKVRVNALCPGTVPTPLVEKTYRDRGGLARSGATMDEMLESTRQRYPLGRLGEVSDVVNMCLFLLSDESPWVTGQSFVVDGGMTAV